MSYLNIIQPDFHLHLKEDAIDHWLRTDVPEQLLHYKVPASGNYMMAVSRQGERMPLALIMPDAALKHQETRI